jgi:hypothetical protein
MPSRKYESVPTKPAIVLWIVTHNLLEKEVRGRGKAYGSSRMTVSNFLNRISGKNFCGFDR